MMKTWPPDEAQMCSSTANIAFTGRTPNFSTLGFSQLHKPSGTTNLILKFQLLHERNKKKQLINKMHYDEI